jgi:hypothetical protein
VTTGHHWIDFKREHDGMQRASLNLLARSSRTARWARPAFRAYSDAAPSAANGGEKSEADKRVQELEEQVKELNVSFCK